LSAFWSIRRRPIKLNPTHVLSLKAKQIESVEARGSLSVAKQSVKVRQPLQAVRHGLAVEHDALEREARRKAAHSPLVLVDGRGRLPSRSES
jgi:hypothetical protein